MSTPRLPPWEQIARASQLSTIASLQTLADLHHTFRNDRTRYRLVERLRWPDGFVCRRCEDRAEPRRPQPGMVTCARCGAFHDLSSSGPIRGKVAPIARWFELLWLFVDRKLALEPQAVSRVLGCSLGEASQAVRGLWSVVEHCERGRLVGQVEVDARVLSLAGAQLIVLVAAERRGERTGRTRVRRLDSMRADAVQQLISDGVEVGSTLHTDCWSDYLGLGELPYHHQPEDQPLRRVEAVTVMLQRWLREGHGTASGGVEAALAEFTMRFNRVRSSTRGELFCKLLASAQQLGAQQLRRRVSGVRRIQATATELVANREAVG